VLNLKVSVRCGLSAASAQIRWTVVLLIGIRSAIPSGAPVGRSLGRWAQRLGDDPITDLATVDERTSRARRIAQASEPILREPATPQQHRRRADREFVGDRRVSGTGRRSEDHPRSRHGALLGRPCANQGTQRLIFGRTQQYRRNSTVPHVPNRSCHEPPAPASFGLGH